MNPNPSGLTGVWGGGDLNSLPSESPSQPELGNCLLMSVYVTGSGKKWVRAEADTSGRCSI